MISQRIQSLFTGAEPVATTGSQSEIAPATAEQQKVDELLSADKSLNSNSITDEIFYSRHPELKGKPLPKGSPLASEWKQIKAEVVEPRMQNSATSAEPKSSTTGSVPAAAESSSMATEAKAFLDMGAGLLQQKLQGAYDTGKSMRDSAGNGLQSAVDYGKGLYNRVVGEEKPKIAPGTPAAPVSEPSETSNQDVRTKGIAFELTGVFETGKVGGDPGTVQTEDNGIISYGKHQATLASESDSLEKILDEYIETSDSDTSKKLEPFMERVRTKDATLKDDKDFIQLLKDAGTDPKMGAAQDEVFGKNYWDPAMKLADEAGVKSPLGKALMYDSMIQHRPETVSKLIERTKAKLEGKEYTEQEFLAVFAEERKQHLLNTAADLRKSTDPEKQKAADMCERDATRKRVVEWKELIDAGNLELTGDISIYGQTIHAGPADA